MHNRIEYIDCLKTFAIFLVIWGHIIGAWGVDSYINTFINYQVVLTFHMPLFAILSGYFFNSNVSWKDFFMKKTMQLLWPLVSWSIIIFGIIPFIKDSYVSLAGGEPIHLFAMLRNVFYNVIDWGWWFLRALYLCFIYAFISVKVLKNNPVAALALSVILFVALAWSGIIPNMHNKLNGFFFLYPFFCIGFAIKHYDGFIWSKRMHILFMSCLAFIIGLFFWRGWPDTFYQMNTSLFEPTGYENVVGVEVAKRSLLRFSVGLAGSIAFLLTFRMISERINANRAISGYAAKIGQSTLGIYILHGFVFDIFGKTAIFEDCPIVSFIFCFISSVVVLVACYHLYRLTLSNKALSFILWGKRQ